MSNVKPKVLAPQLSSYNSLDRQFVIMYKPVNLKWVGRVAVEFANFKECVTLPPRRF